MSFSLCVFNILVIPVNICNAALLLKAAFHAQLGGNAILSDRRWYAVDFLTVCTVDVTVPIIYGRPV